jgi:uncharacterized membrane protein
MFDIRVKEKNMPNEPNTPQSEKASDRIGLGLAMGAGVGTLLGFVFDNLAIGITFGAALGLVFGAVLSQTNKK